MDHSYEEIRKIVMDILSGRESGQHIVDTSQFVNLQNSVAKTLVIRETGALPNDLSVHHAKLGHEDAEDFREVFWDLFIQRIIVLGMNDSNPNYPFFKVTRHGKKLLSEDDTYFYHDTTSFETRIREHVPDIDDVTMLYL